MKTEASIENRRIKIITAREISIGISKWKKEASIFSPTKERTKASPILRNLK
jgi:hypothetical protein